MTYARSWRSPGLEELAVHQLGAVSRGQLRRLGIDAAEIESNVVTERWSRYGDRVVLLQNTAPTSSQMRWVAVLHASDWSGETAALCGGTGAELDGLRGFETPVTHVIVRRGVHVPPLCGIKVHESRRFAPADVHPVRTPPRLRAPRNVIDMAAWSARPYLACVVPAASVQQRVCRTRDLREALDTAGRIRYASLMRRVLDDVEGGAHSLAEINVGRVCRRWGLQPPRRQTIRHDRQGRKRYLDCEWRTSDGHRIVLEVDGGQHMRVDAWWKDMPRERSVVLSTSVVLRCSSVELRVDEQAVVADLLQAGVPRA